jgi:transposase
MVRRGVLTDEAWEPIAPLVPERARPGVRGGAAPHDRERRTSEENGMRVKEL